MKEYNFWKNPNLKLRNSEEISIGDAIDQLLQHYKINAKIQETHILNVWDDTMGEDVAKRTEKLFIRDRKLHVKINSPALVQELYLSKTAICKKLNKIVDNEIIEDIVFL